MRRILRRPMFRGGRVDSRGTGITSGLGYEKGGRVSLQGGGAPFNINPGARTAIPTSSTMQTGASILERARNIPYLRALIPASGGKLAAASPYGLAALGGISLGGLADFIAKSTSTPEGYARLKEMGGPNFNFDETNMDVGEVFDYIDKGNEIGEKYGFFPRGGKAKRLEEMGLADKYDSSGNRIEEIIEKQITNNDAKNNYKNTFRKVTDDTEESTEISKADIEKNKELFAELLGGGKARGEDISNMLMSFAGKALKPEADVKTAFGEFFEEESKRPSSKTKIDQSAAALAINDYIAGKRSKEQTEALLQRLELSSGSLSSKYNDARKAGASKERAIATAIYDKFSIIPKKINSIPETLEEVNELGLSNGDIILAPNEVNGNKVTSVLKIVIDSTGNISTSRVFPDL